MVEQPVRGDDQQQCGKQLDQERKMSGAHIASPKKTES
jgi:hypothetical protein